ncbi:amidohydrolase family protein [Paeniglutamicibacter sp. ABSL32-1]|uniref:amidohydrolase family protein n=1 Tax=Paeniglutamicibacter quisquiliarum TaxID=2849498 RepID=UPI001C2D0DE2|nr:amidohydrolase family protein [Paeniglutamicibacter quisquiliarum]MBV1777957.1 amidohydrolase family protein [Paeniglutamicibacter quisquiliarum]
MDLPAMIHQLTGRPAARLRLAGRGILATGNAADVVVFDPDAIIDVATFADPRQPAAGIKHVFVNGVAAVSGHLPTSALAGRALRRSAEGKTQST